MTRLKLHLVERADFHKYYDPATGMFIPGADAPSVGERVTVEVIFQGGPRVLLHGAVLWRRTTGDARARPGAGVGIDGAEKSKVRYLLGYVRGGLIDVRERRRLPVRLRVAYSGVRGRRVNFTRDLNEEGAFVRTAEMLDLGATTLLLVSPPGGDYKPFEVHATITRQHTDGGDRGVGVRFDFRDETERSRWSAFVHKLESDYLDGRLADDVLL
ncbi:MAG: type pilus assembly PilZ [Myxococcales bacterium]|nr:type pilus assembly PilZ [Myxococcales bacterium]